MPRTIDGRGPWRLGMAAAALAAAACLPPAAMAAQGDAARGAEVYAARCGGCHSVDADRVGPRHAGVYGRRAGSVAGFAYSPALKASRLVWDENSLAQWLGNPESLVPGQRMGYSLADPSMRADVIAYLATLGAK